MTDSAPKQIPPFGLRLPPDLKERVQEAAKLANRSMNAEIVMRLEESFGAAGTVLEIKEDDLRKVIIGIMADGASQAEVREAFRLLDKVGSEVDLASERKG